MEKKRRANKKAMQENEPEMMDSMDECPKAASGSTENLSKVNAVRKNKKDQKVIKEAAKIDDEIQNMGQTKMDTGSTENLAQGNVSSKRKRRKKKIKKHKGEIQGMEQVDGMLFLHLSEGNRGEGVDGKLFGKECTAQESGISVREESSLSDLTVQSLTECPKAAAGSTENLSEANAVSEKRDGQKVIEEAAKITDEIRTMNQSKMGTGSTENLAEGNANSKRKGRRKKIKKNKGENQGMDQEDGMLYLQLSDGNCGEGIDGKLSEKECTAQEFGISARKESSLSDLTMQSLTECTKAAAGSTKNLSEANAVSEKRDGQKVIQEAAKINDEIRTQFQSEMETGSTENLAEGNVNSKRKGRRKKIKKNKGENQGMEQVDGMLYLQLSDGNCGEGIDGKLSEKECTAQECGISARKESSLSDLTVQSLTECPKAAAWSTENLSEVNAVIEKKNGQKIIEKEAKSTDEIQNMDQTKMDTGSTENLAEGNVNNKRKRRRKKIKKSRGEIQGMEQVDGMLYLDVSDGNCCDGIDGKLSEMECTYPESGISTRTESSLSLVFDKENPFDLCQDKDTKLFVRKESSLSDSMHGKGNPLDLCTNEETVLLADVVEVSSNRVSSEIVEERSGDFLRTMEVGGKCIPCESQLIPNPNQTAGENVKLENGLNEVNDKIVVYQGQCYAEGSSGLSSCNVDTTSHLSSKEVECLSKDLGEYPKISPIAPIKRKLIVLDLNGLLATIVMPAPKDCRGDTHILGRAVFKRPFCDDFLKFCFQNFDVGIWSSRSKKVIDRVVDYLLGDLKDKLLFCWDMSHSTQTGYKSLENIHKPLVCKELRKIWENDDPNLPWRKGDYNESNTLLLDDSPYKALLNPLHTAIFPSSYNYEDKNDNSLGPGGDLRVYLEGLLTAENVQKYVEQHPFGQRAISETNLSWGFYSEVLQTMSNNTSSSLPTLS